MSLVACFQIAQKTLKGYSLTIGKPLLDSAKKSVTWPMSKWSPSFLCLYEREDPATSMSELLSFIHSSHRLAIGTSFTIGVPWWLSGKEPVCQCRRHGFNPWIRKIPWRKAWQPTSVFLTRESHRQKSLLPWARPHGSPWDCRVRHDWSYLACMHSCIRMCK